MTDVPEIDIPNFLAYKNVGRSCEHRTPFADTGEILTATAQYFNLSLNDLRSDRRTGPIALARHVAMYLMKKLTRHSYPAIGKRFERDHTTVLHGVRRIESMIEHGDRDIALAILTIERQLS